MFQGPMTATAGIVNVQVIFFALTTVMLVALMVAVPFWRLTVGLGEAIKLVPDRFEIWTVVPRTPKFGVILMIVGGST